MHILFYKEKENALKITKETIKKLWKKTSFREGNLWSHFVEDGYNVTNPLKYDHDKGFDAKQKETIVLKVLTAISESSCFDSISPNICSKNWPVSWSVYVHKYDESTLFSMGISMGNQKKHLTLFISNIQIIVYVSW